MKDRGETVEIAITPVRIIPGLMPTGRRRHVRWKR